MGDAAAARWQRAIPVVFVLIWSTGFIVARLGMPHAPPLKFLAWRYALSSAAFALWVGLSGARWPRDPRQVMHLAVTGVLMHAVYLGGVWSAVKMGLGAGTAALVVGLQPVLTAVWLSARGAQHHVSARQWLGLLLGLAGLLMVVWHKLGQGEAHAASLACVFAALLGITIGTLYQKRFVKPGDVRGASLVQLSAALVVTLPLALLEREGMQWCGELVVALGWSVAALSVGAGSLLYLMIQRGAATQVASLMYLVPPTTALMAWLGFGEPLGGLTLAGMALVAAGVALVVRPAPVAAVR